MQDRELYRRILGIEAPWYVESVELKLEVGEVHVHLQHHDMINWPSPESASRAAQKIEKLDERQTAHLGGFTSGHALLGVEFERGLLLDGTNEFGFGAFVDGTGRNFQFDLQFHGTFFVRSVDSVVAGENRQVQQGSTGFNRFNAST